MYLQLSESNIFLQTKFISCNLSADRRTCPPKGEGMSPKCVCGGGGRAAKRQSHFEIDRNSYNTVLSSKGVDTKF